GEPGTVVGEIDDAQREPARAGEALDLLLRGRGVAADPLGDVQPGRAVAELDEDVPQREAVLSPGDGDEHAVVEGAHVLACDGAFHVAPEEAEVARTAEARVVRAQVHFRLRAASRALHAAPPEITARTSTSSSSSSISPSSSRTSPRITMAVPGSTPSSASRRPTGRRPVISTVRPCGCRCTRMAGVALAWPPEALKPTRAP